MRMIGDYFAVEPDPKPERIGAILLPDTAADAKVQTGVVVGVGAGPYEDGVRVPLGIQVGQRIAYDAAGCAKRVVDGREVVIQRGRKLLGVVD